MTVFMFIVADKVPPNSDSLPLIGIFYFACMVEETLGLMAVCYTLSLYYTDPQWYKMPSWVRWLVVDWSGKLLGIKLDIPQRNTQAYTQSVRQGILEKNLLTKPVHEYSCSNDVSSANLVTMPPNGRTKHRKISSRRPSRSDWTPDGDECQADYWRLAAMIADRIMFIVFLITITVTFIIMFSTVTHECK